MSLNRVIGNQGRIPWHLPEDFKWFKQLTIGHVLVMGRKTFESIGRPLPGRETIVLSRAGNPIPGVRVMPSFDLLDPNATEWAGRDLFVVGGADIYRQALPQCSDLFLTLVKREVVGDTFFPEFEAHFRLVAQLRENTDFEILHYTALRI
jgi:dihydrofolate reductase